MNEMIYIPLEMFKSLIQDYSLLTAIDLIARTEDYNSTIGEKIKKLLDVEDKEDKDE